MTSLEPETAESVGYTVVDTDVRIVESLRSLPAEIEGADDKQLEQWYECAQVILGATISEMIASQVGHLEQVEKLHTVMQEHREAMAVRSVAGQDQESAEQITQLSKAAAASHDEVITLSCNPNPKQVEISL